MAEYRKEKFYWFKLKEDFFKRHDIKIIKAMPNGKDYVIFYLQLLCESLSHSGHLRFSDTIPYNDEMLSVITDTNIDIVRSAMKLFTELKLIEILDDQTIYMSTLKNMIGATTQGAERKQLQRASRSTKLLGVDKKADKCPPEKEIDIDIDIDIEKDNMSSDIAEIIGYLNEKTNSSYKTGTAKTRSLIKARMNEGFSVDDFKSVIDKKVAEWTGTEMEQYLRPETLFGTKFEGYLNTKTTAPQSKADKTTAWDDLV